MPRHFRHTPPPSIFISFHAASPDCRQLFFDAMPADFAISSATFFTPQLSMFRFTPLPPADVFRHRRHDAMPLRPPLD